MKKLLIACTVSLLLHSMALVTFFVVLPQFILQHEKIRSLPLMTLMQSPEVPPQQEVVKPPVHQKRTVIRPQPQQIPIQTIPAQPIEPTTAKPDTMVAMIEAPVEQSNQLPAAASAAKDPDALYSAGQLKEGLVPIYKPDAPYPMVAKDREIEGSVDIFFIVGHKGTVEEVTIQKISNSVFKETVLKVVPTWRFKPPTIDNKPVRIKAAQRIEFRMN